MTHQEQPRETTVGADEDESLLYRFLSQRDIACPLCGYNLRGLTSPRCPECGRELRLSIGMAEPFLRAWVTLAVAVFAAAGIGLMFLALISHLGWPGGLHSAGNLGMVYFLISPLFAWPTVAARRRFLRMGKSAQWRWAILATILCLVSLVAVAIYLK
jgi:DNA-directed RNA polymerase subunit RPC12/RpoP